MSHKFSFNINQIGIRSKSWIFQIKKYYFF